MTKFPLKASGKYTQKTLIPFFIQASLLFVNSTADFIDVLECETPNEQIKSVNWSRSETSDQGQCFTMEIPLSTTRMTFGLKVPKIYQEGWFAII